MAWSPVDGAMRWVRSFRWVASRSERKGWTFDSRDPRRSILSQSCLRRLRSLKHYNQQRPRPSLRQRRQVSAPALGENFCRASRKSPTMGWRGSSDTLCLGSGGRVDDHAQDLGERGADFFDPRILRFAHVGSEPLIPSAPPLPAWSSPRSITGAQWSPTPVSRSIHTVQPAASNQLRS